MDSWAMGATMTLLRQWPYLATSSLLRLQLAGPLVGWQTARHGAGVSLSLVAEHYVHVMADMPSHSALRSPVLCPATPSPGFAELMCPCRLWAEWRAGKWEIPELKHSRGCVW
jgi:hypothetical protein